MNNVILVGTIIDLEEVHEDYLIARIKVYRLNTKKYDLIPIEFHSAMATVAYEALYEGCHIVLKGVLQTHDNQLVVIATNIIRIDNYA